MHVLRTLCSWRPSGVRVAFTRLTLAEVVFLSAIGAVILSFVLYYLIDLRNVFGIRDWLFALDSSYFYFTYTPFFFQHYGRNSGIAELIQFGLLGSAIFFAAYTAGLLYATKRTVSKFCMVLAIALLLFVFEDAGNIRHTLMSYVQVAAGEPDQGVVGTLFELIYFSILASVPLYGLWRYGSSITQYTKAFVYIVIGFLAYALAAGLSFIGSAFQMLLDRDVYTLLGEYFVAISLRLGDEDLPVLWQQWNEHNWLYQIEFFLLDSLIEENIEIIATAALLAGFITLYQSTVKNT